MRPDRLYAAVLLTALLAVCTRSLQAENGLTSAPILNRPIAARASGLGRAFTAIPGDTESVMFNPAGPGFITGTAIYLSYMNGFAGGNYGFTAATVKINKLVLTPAFIYYDSGKMNLTQADVVKGEVTAELDKTGIISAAYTPIPALSVGGSVKFTAINLAQTASASARHYDLGVLCKLENGLSFGAASLNNGGDIKFEKVGAPAPSTLRAGLAYKMELTPPNLFDPTADISYGDILLTTDWSRVSKEKGYYQSGFEFNMKMMQSIMLALRLGYLFDRSEEGFTFGFGVKTGNWNFNFGYEESKDLESRHPVSLSYEF